MNAAAHNAPVIDKDQVQKLNFPYGEVLSSIDEIRQRQADLERALVLGNGYHAKVKIVFCDEEGPKQVETTIWALTDERVILKSGSVLPIRRIVGIVT